ncbi:MAG TPA: hypothetical protein VI546_00785 [candidate division Zixibacteria bacterium]|nr:hypothetical protein [candidate division Zixibacteria bacterium]
MFPIEKKRPNSLKPGAWALQFQISDNFRSFSGLQGFGVSVKHHFSRTKAIRFGIGGGLSTSDFDDNRRSFQADTVRQRGVAVGEGDGESVDLAAQYVFYTSPDAEVNFFFGTGPLVRFAHNQSLNLDNASYGSTYSVRNYTRDETRWNIGASSIFGAEWFAIKSISLHAEYGVSLEYQSSNYSSTGTDTVTDISGTRVYSYESESSGSSIRFNLATVKFGLSVYF